jgi:hypothetical protein
VSAQTTAPSLRSLPTAQTTQAIFGRHHNLSADRRPYLNSNHCIYSNLYLRLPQTDFLRRGPVPGLFLFVLLALMVTACQKTDPVALFLKTDSTAFILPSASAAKLSIAVHSNTRWTASSTDPWLTITPSGGDGDGNIEVSVKNQNYTDSNRVGTLTIAPVSNNAFQPVIIKVAQKTSVASLIWSKVFGGNNNDDIRGITATPDGGYLLAGYTTGTSVYENNSHGLWDALVVKTDATGNKQWSKLFGGSTYDGFNSVVATTDGGFILAGYTQSIDGDVSLQGFRGQTDAWLVKIDGNGNKVWSKTFGGSQNDFATCIISAVDGGYIVSGRGDSQDFDLTGNHNYLEDAWLFKIDDNGNKLWSKLYGGTGWDQAWNVIKSTDGGYMVSGYGMSSDGDPSGSHGEVDSWMMKTDAGGNKIWISVLGGSGTDCIGSVVVVDDGGYVAIGSSRSSDGDVGSNHGLFDGWVIKLNSNGAKVWSKVFGGTERDEGGAIIKNNEGGLLAIFNSQSNLTYSGMFLSPDIVATSLDANGNQLWAKGFGGSYWDAAYAILPSPDGGFILAGQSDSNDHDFSGGHGLTDGFIMKIKTPL